jgi:Ca2+-binding EF-hand superfamily protein
VIEDIIMEVDINKDGKISFEEFFEGMKTNLMNGYLNK